MSKVKGFGLLFSIEYQAGSEGDENIPSRKSNIKAKLSHKSRMCSEIRLISTLWAFVCHGERIHFAVLLNEFQILL